MSIPPNRLVYVTWDGATTSYMESLFGPVLARLGRPVMILQATYAGPDRIAERSRALKRLEIDLTAVSLPSPRRAPRQFAASVREARRALRRVLDQDRSTTVIVRSALGGIVSLGAVPAIATVFDADGLLADERREFGAPGTRTASYPPLRALEAALLARSDVVLCRSEAGRDVLRRRALPPRPPFFVVPNGRDPEVFRPHCGPRAQLRANLGLPPTGPLVLYCGSLGPQYLPEAMLALFARVRARRPDAHFLVLTGDESAARRALGDSALVCRAHPQEVPRFLSAADVGVALRNPTFSQRGVCPIKVAEYLLCGLPMVVSSGIGDLDTQLQGCGGALAIDASSTRELDRASAWVIDHALPERPSLSEDCRRCGERYFTLDHAARGYREAIAAAERARRREPNGIGSRPTSD